MRDIKNRIITLSGQPATGKGTVKNLLMKKYQEQGMQVKEFSTGDKFREYFMDMREMLKAIQEKDSEKCDELSARQTIKTIMYNEDGTLNQHSSEIVKDTLQAIKEKGINLNVYDIEKANRSETLKNIRNLIDRALDGYIKNILIKEINSTNNPNEIWIIDSRLAWHNIPEKESFSVRLTADEKVAGQRAYKRFLQNFDYFIEKVSDVLNIDTIELKETLTNIDNKSQEVSGKSKLEQKLNLLEGVLSQCSDEEIKSKLSKIFLKIQEESYENEEKAVEKIVKRKYGEQARYMERYKIDLENPNNYNLVLDTSNLTPEQEAQIIYDQERKLYSPKGYTLEGKNDITLDDR